MGLFGSLFCSVVLVVSHLTEEDMCGSRGGEKAGVRTPPLKNHNNVGFLGNTGPIALKIAKLSSQHSMLGHHRPASETPFKWRFAGGPTIARL